VTPFGRKLRAMRQARGVTLSEMAESLGVSAAYLSALEHGRRPKPTPARLDQICAYFGVIWDEAEALKDLARLSNPRVVIDTAGLSPEATELANRLAQRLRHLSREDIRALLARLEA